MIEFTRAQVIELLEAADAAAFLSRQMHAFLLSLERGRSDLGDAWIREGLELMAQWETACLTARRGPEDTADESRWFQVFLLSRALGCAVCGYIAQEKGRSGISWFLHSAAPYPPPRPDRRSGAAAPSREEGNDPQSPGSPWPKAGVWR
jgi:hypothetical protein